MAIQTKTIMECDGCGEEIASDAAMHEVSLNSYDAPAVTDEGQPVGTRNLAVSVTMHYHDGCFDRRSALSKKQVEAVIG